MLHKSTLKYIWILLVIVFGDSYCYSQNVLYGYTRETVNETAQTTLNIINPSDASIISSIGPTGTGQITAAAFDPTTGIMYGSHGGGGCCPQPLSGCLLTGDLNTGTISTVGCDPVYGGNDNMPGLSVNSAGEIYGLLLAVNAGINDDFIHLVSVDKNTGVITVIGYASDWNEGQGLEFGPGDVLYMQNNDGDGLRTVDINTGTTTSIGESFTGFPEDVDRVTDMAYDPQSGTMYAVVTDEGSNAIDHYLATVNLTTGEFTNVGPLPQYTSSIAFGSPQAPIPTMSEWGVFILSLLMLIISHVYISTSIQRMTPKLMGEN